jgi:hypothetical protein
MREIMRMDEDFCRAIVVLFNRGNNIIPPKKEA